MKKFLMFVALCLFSPLGFTIPNPKLNVLEIQPQTTVTIPQYCDQFGKMFINVVMLGMKPGYTVKSGVNHINKYMESYTQVSKLTIPPLYNRFSTEVLPTVPTMPNFKEKFKGKTVLTDNEALWIYDLGFDTCLRSLEAMMVEEE